MAIEEDRNAMSPERERPVVRSATVADLEVLASVLADAFFTNPVIVRALADQSRRMRAQSRYSFARAISLASVRLDMKNMSDPIMPVLASVASE